LLPKYFVIAQVQKFLEQEPSYEVTSFQLQPIAKKIQLPQLVKPFRTNSTNSIHEHQVPKVGTLQQDFEPSEVIKELLELLGSSLVPLD
jgi:hypothetical protein